MTVTETPPQAPTAAPNEPAFVVGAVAAGFGDQPNGLAGIVGTGDHKVIGRLYIAFALIFGFVTLAASLLVSVDRIDGTLGNTILDSGTFNQVATFGATGVVFMLLLPLLLGLAFCVVPLQVGADAIAFPRAAAVSFWAWLLGSGTFVAAYAINGGPGGGDFQGVGLWAVSFAMVAAALAVGAVCVVTTVFALRADGMSLARTPLFSWSMLVAGIMWILTLPVLVATLGLIYVDHRYGQRSFGFNGPVMFERIAWSLRQPQIYAFATPLLGLVADVVPVAARTRMPQRNVAMGSIAGLGVLGFGAFLQSSIYPSASVQPVYVAMAILALLPVLAMLGGVASTLKGGSPRLISPLAFTVGALLLLLLGVAGGAAASIERLNLQGTLFELGQSNLVIFAAITAALGGLFWWGSKITGSDLPPALGLGTAGVALLATLLVGLGYAASGAFGNDLEARSGIEALNVVSAAGYGLMLLALLLAAFGLVGGWRSDAEAANDPWGGQTLEWSTASPPPYENFASAPVVTSAEPLLDADADKEKA